MKPFVALMWIVGGCWIVQAGDVTVTTKYGSVLGSTLSFPNATGPFKSVRRFLGIPFASPPLGKLRFSAPEPPKDWKPSTYDARDWSNVCIQPHTPLMSNSIKMIWPTFTKDNYSEDCLYLNVFTPGNSSSSNLPVMVYIHGGAYVLGTPVYRPGDQIALRGVVVVTIQYRLGPFGFLSTGDSAAPGNFGMLDQVEALKWVKENIQAFGGDPSKVTIFGLSAGSTSVALQLLSPLSKGLFHRAISESGTDLSPWATHKTSSAVLHTKSLATTLGCTVRDSQSIVDCLRSKSAETLTMAGAYVMMKNSLVANDIAWSPVVDGHFLLDTPQVLRKKDKFHKVDYMAGFTSHESSMFLNTTFITFTGVPSVDAGVSAAAFRKYLETLAQRLTNDKRNAALGSDAMQFQYTPWPDTSNPESLRQALVDATSDRDFVAPTNAALSAHSRLAPTFMFLFSHVSKLDKRPAWMGSQHGDCSFYAFGMPFWNLPGPFQFDKTDKNVSHFIIETWTNFAKTGKPTPQPFNSVKWNQFNSSNQVYMDIDGDSPKMRKNYRAHEMAFWNWYYPKLMDTKFEEEQPTVNSIATRFVPQGTLAALLIALLVASY